MMPQGLRAIAQPQLEHLLSLLRSGELRAPLSEPALQARGLGACWPQLAWLRHLEGAALEAVLVAVIAERASRGASRLELVWTGPEAEVSYARDTAVVLADLFRRAERSVILAGYRLTKGKDLFAPLHEGMRERGVAASFFLHIDHKSGYAPLEVARAGARAFLEDNWPFGSPTPALYYDPRTVASDKVLLHAKCVVVDERWALVGSANFTHNGYARNIEVGALIDDRGFASDLAAQWRGLISHGLVVAAP